MSFSFNRDNEHTIGMRLENGQYSLVFYDENSFMLDRCECCEEIVVPNPYIQGLWLSPYGSISYNAYMEKFSGLVYGQRVLAYFSLSGNTATDDVFRENNYSIPPNYSKANENFLVGNLNIPTNLTDGLTYISVKDNQELGFLSGAACIGYCVSSDNELTSNTIFDRETINKGKYWKLELSCNENVDVEIESMVVCYSRDKTGPKSLKLVIAEFPTTGGVIDFYHSPKFSTTDLSSSIGIEILKNNTKARIFHNEKRELRFVPYDCSSPETRWGFSSGKIENCLILFGTVKPHVDSRDGESDENNESGPIPKAIVSPQWDSPLGMYIAKELYHYDFNNNRRLGMVEIPNNCRAKDYNDKLEFDLENNYGYELAVLPMAWDPPFQEYPLTSLNLSLYTDFYWYDKTHTDYPVADKEDITIRAFNSEVYDSLENHTSANFSIRKTDCFTTSGYIEYNNNNPNSEISMQEYVSCNFSYYLSANISSLYIFTGPPENF